MNTDNRKRKWIAAGITAALVGTAVLLKDDGLVKNVALALADTMLPQAHGGHTKASFIKFAPPKPKPKPDIAMKIPKPGTEMKIKN